MQQYFENRQCIKFEDIQNQKKKYENIIIVLRPSQPDLQLI